MYARNFKTLSPAHNTDRINFIISCKRLAFPTSTTEHWRNSYLFGGFQLELSDSNLSTLHIPNTNGQDWTCHVETSNSRLLLSVVYKEERNAFAKPNNLEMEEVSEHNADKKLTFGRQSGLKKRTVI